MKQKIAFQGSFGAYSDLACRAAYQDAETIPCLSFQDVFAAVKDGHADLGMLPVENSIAGRVAENYHLLPEGDLHIIGEHYQPVVHHLLVLPGVQLKEIVSARSHIQALMQCREWLHAHDIQPQSGTDTAGSAAEIAELGDKKLAAVASELAGKLYGLDSIATDIADRKNNTTRFLVLRREPLSAQDIPSGNTMTTMLFRVRSVPAALYKALGGFATNGINITKLESYLVGDSFTAAQFYLDVEGRPDSSTMKHALEELSFFAEAIKILGVYPAHPFRKKLV